MNSSATLPLATTAPAPVVPFPATPAAWREHRALAQLADGHERHFRQRVRERFHITLSPQRYRYWIEKVEEVLPGTEFLNFGDRAGRTVWKIRSGSYTLHVVYDETTRRLVTCFPSPFVQMPIKRRRRRRGRAATADTNVSFANATPVAA